jgi:DNA-directed RNA polymerase specialized sigma24 family protein
MMAAHNADTGGGAGRFPSTHYSALVALRGPDQAERERALDVIAQVYWRPVYTYIRLQWRRDRDEAADLTQGFFLEILEKDLFADYDSARARFRTFLRVCLDRFIKKQDSAATRLKRGGGQTAMSIDVDAMEAELAELSSRGVPAPDVGFEREWILGLLSLAVERLRSECATSGRELPFRLFERYDLGKLDTDQSSSYAQLAAEFSISIETVTNHLALARREFRLIVLDLIRSMTGSESEFRDEVRAVLGVDLP